MGIIIRIPTHHSKEVRWVLDIIFEQMLGLDYRVVCSYLPGYKIEIEQRCLFMHDSFFSSVSAAWLKPESLASSNLELWNTASSELPLTLTAANIPILFGCSGFHTDKENNGHLNLDVFGAAFYMLSRYEEVVLHDRDMHDRFPVNASISHTAGFYERPIIDEYVEILWAAMKVLWPMLERKVRHGKVIVTCDVDKPFDCLSRNITQTVRTMIGDAVKRRDVKQVLKRIKIYLDNIGKSYKSDPEYTFDWYMDVCERAGRKSAFYFITDHSSTKMDGCYKIREPKILELIKKIAERGHELGVHSSYNTFRDSKQISRERKYMIEACQYAGVDTTIRGNRQHYLRWDTSITPDYLDKAGFEYDSTGGFAERPGFRYGTSYPFPMWSWQQNDSLKLKQQPLVLMECSVISDYYMGLGYSESALDKMLMIKRAALSFGGDFTFLWHNNHLTTSMDKEYFIELIQ